MMSLSHKQKSAVKKLAKKYKIELMLAFGSQVTGKTHKNSDLDIAILPHEKESGIKYFSDLTAELSEIFDDKEIDLSFINMADPLLLSNICKKPLLLYGNIRKLYNLKIYSFKRFEDYKPYFSIESNFLDKYLKGLSHAGR